MSKKTEKGCNPVTAAVTLPALVVLMALGLIPTRGAHANGGGGGGAGEYGTATHQHLDSGFAHDRYYYDRGYAMHRPPRGGITDLTGRNGERYYFQGGNWFRWRGDWYRSWGGAWIVVDAPVGMLLPSLPPHYTTIRRGGTPYYYANETYYAWNPQRGEYEVVAPPVNTDDHADR